MIEREREREMMELNRPTKKRGFYVKMRISQIRHGRQAEKGNNFYKYLKWVLWFSLSCYFLTSYLMTHHPQTPKSPSSLSKPTVSRSKTIVPSRALFESLNSTFLQQPRSLQGSFKDLKVYVYDLPSKYNSDWLSNERCSNHLFASEVAIHRALLNSGVRTPDPYEADFFFVPIYVSCNFSTVNGFPGIGHARSLIESAVRVISSDLPFWNRSRGSDHVFVASHDFGSCFHTMEDMAIADGVPEVLRNSILLQTFGVQYKHPCQEVENVVIPPYILPGSVRTTIAKSPANRRRDIFAFFRGKMELHPKNISGRFYSKRVRTVIWHKYGGDRQFYLKRHRFDGYQSEIIRSVFCLCPLGWAPWSPRLVESVVLGCVPVIIADGIRLPFPAAVRWPEISLTVAEHDVTKLGLILEHVAATNLSAIQQNLADPAVKRSLLFNDQIIEGDATWQVLEALAQKINRSHRRSRLSGE
ncbi:Glucuronoxylan glucuronosyltransferase [Actinidia chinensis var. chinensis]|uniref:Glucuronoxylan glucuronosyltransferase n=1 Tax=Actinidia chinensis var. chinensis TaxID=1590841 RepID=A0A2R6QT00_ACTCC|nr:Glucuronoxylan glucuronosyltransferase [Actinidia chinensis var. chinensis]